MIANSIFVIVITVPIAGAGGVIGLVILNQFNTQFLFI